MRLDVYLTDCKIYTSRARAARAIQEGCVRVNGKIIQKPSYDICGGIDTVDCAADPVPYVSRGALKLVHALDKYALSVHNLNAIDIGASTGGFTDVLLQKGATSVTCVDVGHEQLADRIRNDPRTTVYEDTDIRHFTDGEGAYDIACTDVSFISIKLIIPHIYRLLKDNGIAVCLIKPQFEVGRKNLNKKGIVKNAALAEAALQDISDFLIVSGFEIMGTCVSPVTGGDGNTEFIAVCRRKRNIDV